jgi:hypothetical protein
MMKKLLLMILFLPAFFSPLTASSIVGAQFDPLEKPCESKVGSGGADEICEKSANPTDPITGDGGIITKIANIFALVAAVIAVIVIIIAGISMMTSAGDAGKVASSRNTIIYTAVGLLVIVLARTIVVFIFNRIQS